MQWWLAAGLYMYQLLRLALHCFHFIRQASPPCTHANMASKRVKHADQAPKRGNLLREPFWYAGRQLTDLKAIQACRILQLKNEPMSAMLERPMENPQCTDFDYYEDPRDCVLQENCDLRWCYMRCKWCGFTSEAYRMTESTLNAMQRLKENHNYDKIRGIAKSIAKAERISAAAAAAAASIAQGQSSSSSSTAPAATAQGQSSGSSSTAPAPR